MALADRSLGGDIADGLIIFAEHMGEGEQADGHSVQSTTPYHRLVCKPQHAAPCPCAVGVDLQPSSACVVPSSRIVAVQLSCVAVALISSIGPLRWRCSRGLVSKFGVVSGHCCRAGLATTRPRRTRFHIAAT